MRFAEIAGAAPCPCGDEDCKVNLSSAAYMDGSGWAQVWSVCGIEGPRCGGPDSVVEDEAVEAWNDMAARQERRKA